MNLSNLDIAILVIYAAAIFYIGWRSAKKVKTIEDFATGGKSYSSFFVMATLAASFTGGGFTTGLAEKVYTFGIIYVIGIWGFCLKEILIAKYVAPQMVKFPNATSVGDIMGQLYGDKAKILTGAASFLVCAGILGAQFVAFGNVCNVLLGISPKIGSIACALILLVYTGKSGMRGVVANDTMHLTVMMVSLPLVFYFGVQTIGGFDQLYAQCNMNFCKDISYGSVALLFLSFFFAETLVPPYTQRLLIGKTVKDTVRGNMASGIFAFPFFLMIGCIGLMAAVINPNLSPRLALPYMVLEVMPIGLKGLAIAGMMAIVLSAADSFINAASVALTNDMFSSVLKRFGEAQKLVISKYSTYLVACTALLFTISLEGALDVLMEAYMFWTPIIIVPFVAGVMGIQRPKKAFFYSAASGVLTVTVIRLLSLKHSAYFEVSIWGIIANFIVFFAYRPLPSFLRKAV